MPWAVIFPHKAPAQYNAMLDYYGPDPRHPSQLYQAGLEGRYYLHIYKFVFGVGLCCRGRLRGEFLVGYALLRMVGERFRELLSERFDCLPIREMNLSRGQFYSLCLLLAGMLTLFFDPQKWHASQIRKRS